MRELPAGRDALLLDFSDEDTPWRSALEVAGRLGAAMASGDLPTVIDVVPAETTVLVQARPGRGLDHLGLRRALRGPSSEDGTAPTDESLDDPVVIGVRYDGPDLAAVADLAGLDVDGVITAHRETIWRVAFMGFAPGFGYLVPDEPGAAPLDALRSVSRRAKSRTSVPAGAVAVAAGYSAVYPRSSPGGWHLLGHSEIALWDLDAQPPAILMPGRLVRFEST
ncbi:5-oxoprolinase subunit B family protein [Williamsia maris]|uniref:Sensor histidine kinase inhibitor, KipI family n=1 Tax=Williamsia maris TaxID=72806 RepID=A0ABT1HAT6_9NOCA|nr:carboxyltransferase domain-containing protein [Williamsia maris]MCP2174860.1 sensor histidine kinase inhibitor, KipI family [Williamsia maris]